MGYQSLVTKQVSLAYAQIQDLATDVVLSKKTVTGFNFGTGSNIEGSEVVVTTKAVVNDSKKDTELRNKQVKELMFKKEDVGDISSYDTVTISGQEWSIGTPIVDDGFVVTVKATREL